MSISGKVGVTKGSGSTVSCTAKVTVVKAGTTTKMGGVTVSGTWSAKKSPTGWPTPGSAITSTSTSSLGRATLISSKVLSGSTGNGCTFVVTSISKAGTTYALNPALTLQQRTGTTSW